MKLETHLGTPESGASRCGRTVLPPGGRVLRARLGWIGAVAGLGALLAGAGCAVGPDYRPPAGPVPAAYHTPAVAPSATAAAPETRPSTDAGPGADLAAWWRVFGDPVLDALVEEAAGANLEIRLAEARLREARALRGVARSGLFPQVNLEGGATRARVSGRVPEGQIAEALGQSLEADFLTGGFDVSWEVDVFGGRRRADEAARAEVGAAAARLTGARVAVLAEVGLTYLELRGAQRQGAVARANLAAQEQTLALTRDRSRAGLASELDSSRAEAQVSATRSRIPPLDEAAQRAIHRLGVLLGKGPGELESRLVESAPLPVAAPRIPVGLPSDLLRQRPDLREAERAVAAATARVGVATADLYPKFYLTGAAGVQSLEATDWLDGGSRFWSLGPTLRWPVFAAGRIRSQVRVADARQEQSLIQFERAVLRALEEVENALVGFGREQERRAALADSEQATRRSVALAVERYRGGLADFLDVLEVERSLLAVQDSLVGSDRLLGQHLVRLYQALGGGWGAAAERGTGAEADRRGAGRVGGEG